MEKNFQTSKQQIESKNDQNVQSNINKEDDEEKINLTAQKIIENKKDFIVNTTQKICKEAPIILYKDSKTLENNIVIQIFPYLFLRYSGLYLSYIYFAIIYLLIKNSHLKDFSLIPFGFSIFNFLGAFLNFYYHVKLGKNLQCHKIFIFSFFYNFSFMILHFGFFLFCKEIILPVVLPLFVMPAIFVVFFVYMQNGDLWHNSINSSFLKILDVLQIFYISLKFSDQNHHFSWETVLFIYSVFVFFLIVFAYFLVFIGIFLIIALIIKRDALNNMKKFVFIGFGIYFSLLWKNYVFYYTFYAVRDLLKKNIIRAGEVSELIEDKELYKCCVALLICSLITLLFLILIFFQMKKLFLNLIKNGKTKQISLQKFGENIKLKVNQVSSTYFNFSNSFNIGNKNKKKAEIGKCIICLDANSEILIKPCGHSGICKICITENLKENTKCPVCRENIKEIYLIAYDEENKEFVAQGIIEFEKN